MGEEVAARWYYTVHKHWVGTESITVELEDTPRLVPRPRGLKTVEYGALVYALPIKTGTKCWSMKRTAWSVNFPIVIMNCCLVRNGDTGLPQRHLRFPVKHNGDSVPFSSENPRVSLKASLCRIRWDYADGYENIAENTPVSKTAVGPREECELIPYGCAKLRMTEMPMVVRRKGNSRLE